MANEQLKKIILMKWPELDQIDDSFLSLIDGWEQWYQGSVSKFHRYTVYNGHKRIPVKRYGLGMAKKLCEDMANMLFNERCQILVDDKPTDDYLHAIFDNNNLWVKINELQELKSAYGTVAIVPYVSGLNVTESGTIVGGGEIKFNYLTAKDFIPIRWNNGTIEGILFGNKYSKGKHVYLYVQKIDKEEDIYYTENLLFDVSDKNVREVPLETIAELESVPPRVVNGPVKPFVIDRLNMTNNVDRWNPMGLPIFANSIDVLMGLDIAYDSYINEFILGRKRIFVNEDLIRQHNADGTVVEYFDNTDVVFQKLPTGYKNESTQENDIVEIDMHIRAQEHNDALDKYLNLLGSKCGMGERFYSWQSSGVKTATEVISENSNLYRSLKKHEIILDAVIVDFCNIVLDMAANFIQVPNIKTDANITVRFDDSIIQDKVSERNQDMIDVGAGIMSPAEYRAKWYSETIEQAKANIPANPEVD